MTKFYSFDAIIAFQGFHVCKETTWSNAKVGDKAKIEIESNPTSITIDPYSCEIKTNFTIISLEGKPSAIFFVKYHDIFIFLSNN